MLHLTANIQRFNSPDCYLGWIEEIEGIVVQGSSPEEIKRELIISLQVKYAYDNNIPIENLNSRQTTGNHTIISSNPHTKPIENRINLVFA